MLGSGLADHKGLAAVGTVGVAPARAAVARRGARHRLDQGLAAGVERRGAGDFHRRPPDAAGPILASHPRRVPAAAPAALATPATGPSSTAAVPATTTAHRIRPRIATPTLSRAHAASGAGDHESRAAAPGPGGVLRGTENNPPLCGGLSTGRTRSSRSGAGPPHAPPGKLAALYRALRPRRRTFPLPSSEPLPLVSLRQGHRSNRCRDVPQCSVSSVGILWGSPAEGGLVGILWGRRGKLRQPSTLGEPGGQSRRRLLTVTRD